MRYTLFLCVLFVIFFSAKSFAQRPDHFYFLSPGIKLGYAFGEEGGLTYGVEISYIKTGIDWSDPRYGIVLDVDRVNGATRIQLGGEYMKGFVLGVESGMMIHLRDYEMNMGISVTPFIAPPNIYLLFMIPYYSYTYMISSNDFHEIGSYTKIPLQVRPKRDSGPSFPYKE